MFVPGNGLATTSVVAPLSYAQPAIGNGFMIQPGCYGNYGYQGYQPMYQSYQPLY